ncbi:MAG: hydrogenase [Deltaproteobacteria bacterium]|nr:MAG: hydrogenase [Deltaproteobacteria bacterium]
MSLDDAGLLREYECAATFSWSQCLHGHAHRLAAVGFVVWEKVPMIVRFQTNPIRRTWGIILYMWQVLLFSTLCVVGVYLLYQVWGVKWMALGSAIPLGVIGTALAIFLGFRNNSAYDRWWEGRKIWGGIVNISRTMGAQIMTYVTDIHVKDGPPKKPISDIHRELVYRHIAYINALRLHLRKQFEQYDEVLSPFLEEKELQTILSKSNKPTQIAFRQSQRLKEILKDNMIEDFRLYEMMHSIETLYELQGKCERIKNTPFPLYYSFFTRMILYIFVLFLPLSVIGVFDKLQVAWAAIPVCILTACMLGVIERTARTTENPFENYFGDVSMTGLCRTIEIDLREMLDETDTVPPPLPQEEVMGGIRVVR